MLSSFGRWSVVFYVLVVVHCSFCNVTTCKMKRSLENSDLSEGHGRFKSRNSLEFWCEVDRGDGESKNGLGLETAKDII